MRRFLSTYFRCSLRIRLHGYKNTLLILLLTCNFSPPEIFESCFKCFCSTFVFCRLTVESLLKFMFKFCKNSSIFSLRYASIRTSPGQKNFFCKRAYVPQARSIRHPSLAGIKALALPPFPGQSESENHGQNSKPPPDVDPPGRGAGLGISIFFFG